MKVVEKLATTKLTKTQTAKVNDEKRSKIERSRRRSLK